MNLSVEAKKELANSLTHGFGLLLCIIGIPVLMAKVVGTFSVSAIWACAIFMLSLLMTYTSSTLYHSIPFAPVKRVLRIVDHSAIYCLIAGSYTPFTVIYLWDASAIYLLIVLWSLVVVGILFKLFFTGRFRVVSTMLYLGMGWLAVFMAQPLYENLPAMSFILLAVGGLSYSFGVIFYLWKGLTYHHAIWHLFVLAGSIMHYFALLYALFQG